MEPNARKMLNYLSEPLRALDYDEDFMPLDKIYSTYGEYNGCSQNYITTCLQYLADKGFIDYAKDESGNIIGVKLKYKAYHHKYFTWVSIRSFLGKSIVVPIVVTLLTLIVINLAKDVLPQWLVHLLR